MTVYFVVPLPKTPCIHHIYMVLANLNYMVLLAGGNHTCDRVRCVVWFWPTINVPQFSSLITDSTLVLDKQGSW
jgi:hypothetical protein